MSTAEPGSPIERIGTTLRGKWTLEKLLGEGGMASVYVARHKIGHLEAIKIMHSMVASSPELRARFEQEARLANRFHHRGAVEIRDIDVTEDGAPFLVMELLDGETLSAIARASKEPFDVATVLRVADEVLDVLAAAHATGIIHRDIKPDNLLLTKQGPVKVLDFGIARLREGLSRDVKTHTGTTLGTVAYMAPEQAKGGDVDARVDIYAMGATMFRLLAGRRVHEADTEAERLAKLMSGSAEPLASVATKVPAAVCAIVDRALAFDRANRYPDALSMQADVRAARGEAPTSSSLGSSPAVTVPTGEPTAVTVAAREATTRAEGSSVADTTTRDAPTVKSDAPPPLENLKTERMPGAPAFPGASPTAAPAPGPGPLPAPAPTSEPAPAGALAQALAPKNRRFVLIAGGLFLLGIALLVAAYVVGARSGPSPADAPGVSEPATATAVAPATPSVRGTTTVPPPGRTPTHPPPPPPRGEVHGH